MLYLPGEYDILQGEGNEWARELSEALNPYPDSTSEAKKTADLFDVATWRPRLDFIDCDSFGKATVDMAELAQDDGIGNTNT